ncbi:dienelactone hydrolase family protein [Paracraurococcus lichenis]|uniref:Dienelactone hydrolase family protein n=1 Tax=Paracraurococcus lichenis TaxID=3064888 RepID=A0ABT9DUX9_9PROT|nr:dienelactone hydrolase family protein [Paracraurococcus sp. LOR1-02]MDO9707706.1 dienelactone hydrolase family protein [Paracraurococcus sp. LOR1-02]
MQRLLLPILVLLAPCAAAQGVPAPSPVAAEPVTIPGPEGVPLRALLVRRAGTAPGIPVIALHGCNGMGGPERPQRLSPREADWAARLSAAGHPVLFPDSFASRGLGEACGVRGFPAGPRVRRADAHAAAAWAQEQPWAAKGGALLLGWSHGGSTVLAAVAEPLPPGLLRAAIAFYPGCGESRREAGWTPGAPLLMQLGASDDWTPPASCLALAAAHPGRIEADLYPGANHGFDAPALVLRTRSLPDGRVVTFGTEPLARDAARSRVAAFLAAHGGAAP